MKPSPARTPAPPPRDSDVPGNDTYETARTFESLGVSTELTKALADEGIVSAFPIQALTVADALAGRDVCGKAKTGSGKTLAFGVPLLQRAKATREAQGPGPATRPAKPLALVLLPTRELAVQVHDVLAPLAKKLGLRAVAVYGGADIDRQVSKLRKGVDVVIATPGRLIDLGDRGEVAVDELETLVLDEADRMADMGFMPQVEWVLRRLDQPHQTLLFSATLDGAVDRLVKRYLTDPVFHEVASSTQTVTLMEHRFLQVHQMDKVKVAAAICRSQEKSLLFVRTKRGADRLVENLGKEGIKAAGHPRRPTPGQPRAGPGRLLERQALGARGHRRGGPGAPHRRRRRGHPLRPARGPQGLPPPLGPHGPGRQGRRGRQPVAVEPAGRDGGDPAPAGPAHPHRRDVLQRPAPGRPGRLDAPARGERPLSEDAAIPLWSPDDGVRRVLVVTAHPDDVDFGAAGTVAAFTAAGLEVTYCIVTDGDAGGSDRTMSRSRHGGAAPGRAAGRGRRRGRQRRALPGASRRAWSSPPRELRRDISRVIRQVRPERVLTQSPERNWEFMFASHPDHLAAGEATVCAVYPDARNPFAHPELLDVEGLEPWTRPRAVGHGSRRAGAAVAVETTATIERKMAALLCHKSQIADPDGRGQRVRDAAGGSAEPAGLPEGRSAELFRVTRIP